MYKYRINENGESVCFDSKKDFQKAMKDLKNTGFEKLTKGFYYNRITKENLYTSEIYYI